MFLWWTWLDGRVAEANKSIKLVLSSIYALIKTEAVAILIEGVQTKLLVKTSTKSLNVFRRNCRNWIEKTIIRNKHPFVYQLV